MFEKRQTYDINHQRGNFLWSDCPDFIELLFMHSDWMNRTNFLHVTSVFSAI